MKNEKNNVFVLESSELDIDLNVLEEALEKLTKKVKRVAKKNGFSKKLKSKADAELWVLT